MRHPKSLFIPVLFLTLLVVQSVAHAFVAPLQTDGEHFYLHEAQNWQIAVANIELTPRFDPMRMDTVQHSWQLDAELWVRNVSADKQSVILGIADNPEHTSQTIAFVDGERIETVKTAITYEPRYKKKYVSQVRRFNISVPNAGKSVIRISMIVDAVRDDAGEYSLLVPTDLLALLSPKILNSFLRIDLNSRPIGMRSTLSGFTYYDSPVNRISWFALDWKPRIPLEIKWMESWSLLTRIAEVEQCPVPWKVVQAMARANLKDVDSELRDFDTQTLRFCASLPLMLHGYVFPSRKVREQFRAVPLRRYLGKDAGDRSVYFENPSFDVDDLPHLERVYRNTLQSTAKDREEQ